MSLSPKQSSHIPTPRVANCHMASHWLPLPRPGPGLPDTCEQGARVGFHSCSLRAWEMAPHPRPDVIILCRGGAHGGPVY